MHTHACADMHIFWPRANDYIFGETKKALDLFLQELDTDMVASKATLDTAHNRIMSRPLPAKEWDKIEAAGADRLESGDCKCERLALSIYLQCSVLRATVKESACTCCCCRRYVATR